MLVRATLFPLVLLTACGSSRSVRSENPLAPLSPPTPGAIASTDLSGEAEWARTSSLPHRTLPDTGTELGVRPPTSEADRISARIQRNALGRIQHLFPDTASPDADGESAWVYYSVKVVSSSGTQHPAVEAIRVQRQLRRGGPVVSESLILAEAGEVLLRTAALTPSPPRSVLIAGFAVDLREPEQVRRLASLSVAPLQLGAVVRMGRAQVEENLRWVQDEGWSTWDLPHEEAGLFIIEGPWSPRATLPWPFESASLDRMRINEVLWKTVPEGVEWRARVPVSFYGPGNSGPFRREFILRGTL